MPSSRARRRRAQQRRGPGAQRPPRPPTTAAPPIEPASVEEAESLEPVREQAEADAIDAVETEEVPGGVAAEPGFEDPIDAADVDGGLPDLEDEEVDETLEEQEADVERAEAELEEQREQPAARERRARPVPADRRPPQRSAGRNRRRGATPQPQGPPVVRFFRETFDELRKVDWPTPSELYRYTIIVIVTVIVMAAFIAGIDWALQQLAQRFIYGASVAGG
jgi:preprotein translocase subunit SecE